MMSLNTFKMEERNVDEPVIGGAPNLDMMLEMMEEKMNKQTIARHVQSGPDPLVDYEIPKSPLCAMCRQPISGRCITAMFRKFHPECFVCSFCLKQLNRGTFKVQEDKPYCHQCFDRVFG